MSVFFCYIVLVLGTFCLFILFYADNPDGISAQTILQYSIGRYHNNRNIADLVDYMQEQVRNVRYFYYRIEYRIRSFMMITRFTNVIRIEHHT